MKIQYDQQVDILSIRFSNTPIAESDMDKPGIIIDYDEEGGIVSIELLNASKRMPSPVTADFEVV